MSDKPIAVTGFTLTNVPDGATVIRYRVLATTDASGFLLGSFPVERRNTGYDSYPGYRLPVIQPHRRSLYYAVVYLRVVGPLAEHASGCQVSYTVNDESYTRESACDFLLDAPR